MKNRLILTCIFLFGLYLIVSFSRDLWYLLKKENQIAENQLKLEQIGLKNEELQSKLLEVGSQSFIEREAREKLGMAKEGETVLILPERLGVMVGSDQPQEQELSNWEKWWKLFF